MLNLKIRFIVILFSVIIITNCSSAPKYEIKTHQPISKYGNKLHVIEANPHRLIHKCVDFRNAENDWRYHYYIYILNDENKVIEVGNPTDQDIDDCTKHLKKVEKIFKNQKTVRLCIRGDLEKSKFPDTLLDFKELGKFPSGYVQPDFDSICNSKECFSINEIWTTTCPGFKKY